MREQPASGLRDFGACASGSLEAAYSIIRLKNDADKIWKACGLLCWVEGHTTAYTFVIHIYIYIYLTYLHKVHS